MVKGTTYPSERRILRDEATGIGLIRLSGFPTLNYHAYMHARCFSYDSKEVVFYSQRQLMRGSPRDLFAVSTDGLNLRQITDRDDIGWTTCSPLDRSVFCACGKSVIAIDLGSLEEREVARAPEGLGFSMISIGRGAKRLASCWNRDRGGVVLLTDLARGSTEVIHEHRRHVGHLQLEPARSETILFHDGNPATGRPRLWVLNMGGTDPRIIYDGSRGDPSHFVWLPGRDAVATTLQPSHQGILRVGLEGEHRILSSDEHFWHAGASPDGALLCSDTLIPDTGLHIVDADTGRHRRLCLSKSSNAHPQWSHPHPTWSPDGKMVIFTSDREGMPQVYVAGVPEGFLED